MTKARINWKPPGLLPSGSRYWDSRDGMVRLVCSEMCDGIALPIEWKLYAWKRGMWHRIAEGRGRARIEKIARGYVERFDSED